MNKNLLLEKEFEESFNINENELSFKIEKFPITINSFPKKYNVRSIKKLDQYEKILNNANFIIIDEKVEDIYPIKNRQNKFIFSLKAKEDNKNMNTVLELIDLFIKNNISKGSKVVAVGGGIVQDIAACACALFRRGLPFIYMPTTTLGQLDSCVGAKCAVNTPLAKNILGLFSAPREVIIPTFVIKTMPLVDHRAGLSEMLRLCLTASDKAVKHYSKLLPFILNPRDLDDDKFNEALELSLSIKKSVVDFDEYEKDVRRSMNYGHTFGHAIEKLVNFKIPHGLGVLLGIHIANNFSKDINLMEEEDFLKISTAIKCTLKGIEGDFQYLLDIKPTDIVEQFKFDKKGDGESVPLILIKNPGNMIFYKYFFKNNSEQIITSISRAIKEFTTWTK